MDAYIYDAVRTARGAAHQKGGLASVKPHVLLKSTLSALKTRHPDAAAPSELIVGCVTQTGEQGGHLARTAAILAGLPTSTSAMMLNNFCCSGLDACQIAGLKTAATHELIYAGGVESMSRVAAFSDNGPYYSDRAIMQATSFAPLWISADFVATSYDITRQEADAYAAQSQQKALKSQAENRGKGSIIPVETPSGIFDTDETPRPNTTKKNLAGLTTLHEKFDPKNSDALYLEKHPSHTAVSHIHHVGNAPSLADAAALVLIGSAEAGQASGLKPRARIRSVANAAADPLLSLTGGIEAAKIALKRAGMKALDIDLYEFNEAYAAVCLLFQWELGIDPATMNVNGGAIALGHPMGATGAILLGTILDELENRGQSTGLISLSGAAGLGSAMIIERV
ncbi:MAG: acetyl-CoA C-acyltransferase [Kordiimonadaceae bacterium]|nr:acetyl-CoA C-acyltransferase [Kordiimonadaceae bacterium]